MSRPNVWLSVDFDFFVPEDPSWDFGHVETKLGVEFAWTARLAEQKLRGTDLRKVMSLRRASPPPGRFWRALEGLGYRFDKVRSLMVADSHRWAYFAFNASKGPAPETTQLVHFDAHHDLLYRYVELDEDIALGEPQCDNWHFMTLLDHPDLQSLIVYPKWKGLDEWEGSMEDYFVELNDLGRKVLERATPVVWPDPRVGEAAGNVDRIFICRSGAWVPPWHDRAFQRFCQEAGEVSGRAVETPFKEEIDPLVTRKIDLQAVNDAVLLEMTLLGLIGPIARV